MAGYDSRSARSDQQDTEQAYFSSGEMQQPYDDEFQLQFQITSEPEEGYGPDPPVSAMESDEGDECRFEGSGGFDDEGSSGLLNDDASYGTTPFEGDSRPSFPLQTNNEPRDQDILLIVDPTAGSAYHPGHNVQDQATLWPSGWHQLNGAEQAPHPEVGYDQSYDSYLNVQEEHVYRGVQVLNSLHTVVGPRIEFGPQYWTGPTSQDYHARPSSEQNPWSPYNTREARQPPHPQGRGMEVQKSHDMPDHTGSQPRSNVSSDWSQPTYGSSLLDPAEDELNEMSASTTTIKPLPGENAGGLANCNSLESSGQSRSYQDMFRGHVRKDGVAIPPVLLSFIEDTPIQAQQGDLSLAIAHDASVPRSDSGRLLMPQNTVQGSDPSSPATSTVSAASSSTPTVLVCTVNSCCSEFRGEYRKGNFARHIRMKHAGKVKTYPCEGGCQKKSFLRKDARLKHYRSRHPELAAAPAVPRKG